MTEVYDQMAAAKTYRQLTVGSNSPLSDVFGPPGDVLETFRSDAQSRIEGDETVRIKDPVRQVMPPTPKPF